MTQRYKKKLIEVAIPLEAINAASAREKSIRHGHPSTLHLWWARRPLAACRAVLFAQLVDDPSSLPEQFPTAESQDIERKRLFAIIEDLVKWENSNNEEVLGRARAEILRSCNGVLPPVYDPFSGGGSIPLEAQRLGLASYGSDLNPVAVTIGKAMIEFPPKFKDLPPIHPGIKERSFYRNAEGLSEDIKYYGEWMREKAWERIGHLYPQVELPKQYGGGKATVIAWIWSRTVPSPDPAFSDVYVPIASSFLLSSGSGKEAWIEPIVNKESRSITYHIRLGGTKDEIALAKTGTKSGRGSNFRCLISNSGITPGYIKGCGSRGEIRQTLIAIVAKGKSRRFYLAPEESHVIVANSQEPAWRPNLELPGDRRAFTPPDYGMPTFGDLFTNRQLVALNTFGGLISEARAKCETDAHLGGLSYDSVALQDGGRGTRAYSELISIYLLFIVNKLADLANSLCNWEPGAQCPKHLFGRHVIPIVWDFAEGNVFSGSSGSIDVIISGIEKAFEKTRDFNVLNTSSIRQANASEVDFGLSVVISTDPPYYDNVPYAGVSDFFYVWMQRYIAEVLPSLFGTIATPKMEELVADRTRHGGNAEADAFFLSGMRLAMTNFNRQMLDEFPAAIYYAFKQSEIEKDGISSPGWATFLTAIIESGFRIEATWPMRTENASRLRAAGSNALANSVVLVCRKREASADVITRAEFIRALKRELPPAISELQAANIAPADMPQSAIGPGMGVFSRYKAVLESDDSAMSVKAALQLINRELGEHLEGIQGDFDADTRFAITWFEQNGLKAGDYGTANSIAQARGITVESVKHAGIVESQGGRVRVLRRDELDDQWEPGTDQHLTIWECLQHLVRLHEKDGISQATAVLLKKIGNKAEAVKDLAYILYDISANKRQDAKEAIAYNALIADWTELSRQSAAIHDKRGDLQQRLDF